MNFDVEYKLRATVQNIFKGFELEIYKKMDLGRHFHNFINGNYRIKSQINYAMELIKFIQVKRLKNIFPLSKILKKEKYEHRIQQELDKYAKLALALQQTVEAEEDSSPDEEQNESDEESETDKSERNSKK